MNAPHKRRVSTGSALVAAVLVIGVAGIVYSRVEQGSDAAPAARATLAGDAAPVLNGTPDPKAAALIPAGFTFVTPGTLTDRKSTRLNSSHWE